MAIVSQSPSISEVKTALAETANSVGGLCTSPKINKWSRRKPVRHSSVTRLTEAQLKSVRSGINIPKVDGASEIISYYRDNPEFKWEYNKPRGGLSEPYRLTDFSNYEQEAEIFYRFYSEDHLASTTKPEYLIQLLTLAPLHPLDPKTNWIGWDALNLENLYYGVLIVRQGTTSPSVFTFANEPLSELSSHIFAGMPSPVPGAKYDVFSFVAEKDDPIDPRLGQAYLLENGHRTFTYNAGLTVFLEGEMTDVNATDYFFRITNNTDATITVRNLSLYIRYGDTEDPLSPIEPGGEYVHNFGDVNITAGGNYNYSDTVTQVLNEINNRGAYLYLYASSPAGVTTTYPLEPYQSM